MGEMCDLKKKGAEAPSYMILQTRATSISPPWREPMTFTFTFFRFPYHT